MSDNPEEKEFELKGVIPAKVTTAEEFHESLENLRKYRQRYERQTQIVHETLVNFTDYFRKHPSILEDAVNGHEEQAQIARKALESFVNYLEKHPSLIEEIMEALESFVNYLEKHPSILEEVMKEHEQERFKEEHSFDC
jgi:hypothetical protein